MLTPDDGRPDGGRVHYLKNPGKWRTFDPQLFDFLSEALSSKAGRTVALLENSPIIPAASYHSPVLRDGLAERERYFDELVSLARGKELIFFDQDNGSEVQSVRKGQRNSGKYLYWDEIERFYQAGHSLLLYQHFQRTNRNQFVRETTHELERRTGASKVQPFVTQHTVFFLAPQERDLADLEALSEAAFQKWNPYIWGGGKHFTRMGI